MSVVVKGVFISAKGASCTFHIESSTEKQMLLVVDEKTVVVDLVKLREEKLAAFFYWVYLAEQVIDFKIAEARIKFIQQDGTFGMPRVMTTDPKIPSKVHMAMNYAAAVYKWNKAGKPKRSDAEVSRIHTNICLPCPYYQHKSATCGKCGCTVNSKPNALGNKIAMETEHCPVGRW